MDKVDQKKIKIENCRKKKNEQQNRFVEARVEVPTSRALKILMSNPPREF